MSVSLVMTYTGIGVPDKLDFDLEFLLDAKKDKQKRMFLMDAEGESKSSKRISMTKEQQFKDRFKEISKIVILRCWKGCFILFK